MHMGHPIPEKLVFLTESVETLQRAHKVTFLERDGFLRPGGGGVIPLGTPRGRCSIVSVFGRRCFGTKNTCRFDPPPPSGTTGKLSESEKESMKLNILSEKLIPFGILKRV